MNLKELVNSGGTIKLAFKQHWNDDWNVLNLRRLIDIYKGYDIYFSVSLWTSEIPKSINEKWSDYRSKIGAEFTFYDFDLAYECLLEIYNHESNMVPYIEKLKSMKLWDYDKLESDNGEYKKELEGLMDKLRRDEKIDELMK